MAKPKTNKHRSPKDIAADQGRNERRKDTIASRTAGQWIDMSRGQRQKLLSRRRWSDKRETSLESLLAICSSKHEAFFC